MIKKKIIIATGGSGGHVFPAYSFANYLIDNKFKVKLTTDQRGLKYLKDYKNLKLVLIKSSPLNNSNFLKFIFSILIIFFSIIKSSIFLLFNRPAIVIGMGGYSSFPICLAASILRIPIIIYENNLIIGKANKYLLPFAEKLLVSYKDLEGISEKYKVKVVEVGNIIREEIINFNFLNKKEKIDNKNILVLGGSQAAKIFAEELPQIFEKIKNNGLPIKIYQQCLKNQNDQLTNFYNQANIDYEIFNFTDRIIDYYTKASLVITRSGASVLGELINVKIPFISIPLPSSADNHQYKNAEFYKKRGYGYLLEEKNIKSSLFDLINEILNDRSLLQNILSNQKKYSDKNIFKNLRVLLKEIIDEKN